MNTVVVIIFLMSVPFFSGCDMGNTQHNIDIMKGTIHQISEGIKIFDSRVVEAEQHLTAAETVLRQTKELLSDPNLSVPAKEEALAMIDRALEAKAKAMALKTKWETMKEVAQSQIVDLEKDIVEAEAGGVLPGDDMVILGRGISNTGKSLPEPVGPILGLLGGIIAAIGETRRRKAVKVARGVVSSVDVIMEDMNEDQIRQAKFDLKTEQRKLGVRAGVKKLLDT